MIKIPDFLNTLLDKAKSLVMEELNPNGANSQSNTVNEPNEPNDITQNQVETKSAPIKKITLLKVITAIFNGMGIGLLLGVLLGLAVSPVVSGVVAALSGLLAVLLGLDEKYLDPLKSIRIGSFGFSAVAGILMGLYIRAHDPLSPSLLDKKTEYMELGISEPDAIALIMKKVQSDTAKHAEDDNVLFSSSVKLGDCRILERIAITDASVDIINTFKRAGGTWREFADSFESGLPEEIVGKALITMRDCFCSSTTDGTIKMSNLPEVRKLGEKDSIETIEEVLKSPTSGNNWNTIVLKVRENFPDKNKKDLYLLIIKVLSHD